MAKEIEVQNTEDGKLAVVTETKEVVETKSYSLFEVDYKISVINQKITLLQAELVELNQIKDLIK